MSAGFDVVSVSGDPLVAEVGILRFRGDDRFMVETVDGLAPPLPRQAKWIVNISTQAGCPVGCPFCDAGTVFLGNLTAEEMLAQVCWAVARHPGVAPQCKKLKVHFARMGEPSLNDAVLDAILALPRVADSKGLWACVATVAPAGRERWFERLISVKEEAFRGRFQLQFSVQSTDAKTRQRLIPVRHWDLPKIAEYGRMFAGPKDRKVVLNFALAREVPFEPSVIVELFDPEAFAVKLTPLNPTARGRRSGFATVLRGRDEEKVWDAVGILRRAGFDVVVSIGDEREDLVGSNCGQTLSGLRERSCLGGA